MTENSKKQQITGLVVSDKMDKTIVVRVDIKKRHPKYKKTYTVSRKFKAHDENNEYHKGDKVVIESTRPTSREKKFKVISKIEKSK
jgi:small subunit ribosomal protein S17